jgi:hypothetical protein
MFKLISLLFAFVVIIFQTQPAFSTEQVMETRNSYCHSYNCWCGKRSQKPPRIKCPNSKYYACYSRYGKCLRYGNSCKWANTRNLYNCLRK